MDGEINPNLAFYQSEIPNLIYSRNDANKVIAESGFLKDQEFIKNNDIPTYELKIPQVKQSSINRYTFERGSSKASYIRSRVVSVEYKLNIDDNREAGELGNIYRLYSGSIFETRPYHSETYFNEEKLSDWKSRMTVKDEHTAYQAKKIRNEESATIKYIYDFIKNYEKDIPLQALEDETIFEKTEDFYGNAIQTQDHSKKISKELEGYRNTAISSISTPEWEQVFNKMDLNQKYDKYMISDIILGIIEEERQFKNPDTVGFANIYFEEGSNTADSKNFWIDGTSYKINKEEAETPYRSIYFISNSLRNLILRYNGDLLKAIFAYHINPRDIRYISRKKSRHIHT